MQNCTPGLYNLLWLGIVWCPTLNSRPTINCAQPKYECTNFSSFQFFNEVFGILKTLQILKYIFLAAFECHKIAAAFVAAFSNYLVSRHVHKIGILQTYTFD